MLHHRSASKPITEVARELANASSGVCWEGQVKHVFLKCGYEKRIRGLPLDLLVKDSAMKTMVAKKTALALPGTVFEAIIKSDRLMWSNCFQAEGVMCHFFYINPFGEVLSMQSVVVLKNIILREYIDKRLQRVATESRSCMVLARKRRGFVLEIRDRWLMKIE